MRKIFAIALAAVAAVSCGNKEGRPVEEALQKKVMEENPDLVSYKVEKVRTEVAVRLPDELSRREGIYSSQVHYREGKVAEYQKKGMPNNVAKQRKALGHMSSVLEDLQQYRGIYAPQMDSVIYYVVSFTGSGSTKDGRQVKGQEMKAAVGPDLRVYQIVTAEDNVYRGMGRAVPAYDYIIARNRAEYSEEED